MESGRDESRPGSSRENARYSQGEPPDEIEQLMKKWEKGIDLKVASLSGISEYIVTKLSFYIQERATDEDLWQLFKEDFGDFTVDSFRGCTTRELQRIRQVLRCGGVYVGENNKDFSIAKRLVEILREDAQHQWQAIELATASLDLKKGPITSVWIEKTPSGFIHTQQNYRQGIATQTAIQTPPPANPESFYRQPGVVYPTVQLSQDIRNQGQAPNTPNPPPGQAGQAGPQQTRTYAPLATVQVPSKLISEVAKSYTEEQKYDGINSCFDLKLAIFLDICQRVDLPASCLLRAFPTMLKGLALDHFYTNQLSSLTYEEACNSTRNFFEGPGYQRRNLDKWNSINLSTIAAENPQKGTYENVQALINTLRQVQYGLTPALRGVEFLHNKIVTACQGHPACRMAVADPPTTLGELINKLQSSITTYEKEQQLQGSTDTYYTDRSGDAYYTDRRYRSGQDRPKGNNRYKDRPEGNHRPYTRNSRRCFICKKEDCRSWKHPQQEQDAERARFKSRNLGRFNANARNFDGRFKEAYRQYVTEFEGDSDSEDDLTGAFQTLLVYNNDDSDDECNTKASGQINQFDHGQVTQFFTTITGQEDSLLDHKFGKQLAYELANKACLHQLTAEAPTSSEEPEVPELLTSSNNISRYNSDQFYGIVIDTGASKYSTAGFGQFQAFQGIDNSVQLDQTTKGKVNVQFGIGSTSSIGSALVNTPIGQVEFHVMPCKTPFLLSLDDMDALGVYFNNITNVLVSPQGNVPVVRRFGHSFLLWNSALKAFIMDSFNYTTCYLTNVELQRVHRRFGHPSVARLQKVLEQAGHDIDKEALEYLTKYCVHCQRHGQSPHRFKFNLRDDDDVQFNHSIIVDIFYINGKPVLHIVDEGTRYQAGRWLQNISAKHTWDVLRMCWIDTYLGPPEQITTDAGKNFVSKEFGEYANTLGIKIKIVPVEAHNSIGIVERYHGPIRRAYSIITAEIQDIDKDVGLQMALKAVNDTAGPNGIVPTLLVYGAYPRMSEREAPTATVTQRALAINKAMAEIRKLRAKRQVNDALNTRNGPNTTSVLDLPLNSQVLVWREGNTGQTGSWGGPYKLVNTNSESCVVALPYGNTTFRSTMVKPYLTPITGIEGIELPQTDTPTPVTDRPIDQELPQVQRTATNTEVQPAKRGRGRPRKHPIDSTANINVYLQEDTVDSQPTHRQYEASRQSEVTGLIEKGVFEVVNELDIPQGTRIFNARFVDEIKNKGTNRAIEKSRLVVQAYHDEGKRLVLTQSPTIQRISQRIILCLAAMQLDDTKLYLRDISQAYVQSTTLLNRDFYIRPPYELAYCFNLKDDQVLKVVKPLYGVPEAGNHWFKTYHNHHIDQLGMEQSTYDPCLLYSPKPKPFGVVGLQTDDTLFVGDDAFARQEELQLQKAGFLAKDREELSSTNSLKFNGGAIEFDVKDGAVRLSQEKQCLNLRLVTTEKASTTSTRGTVRKGLTTKEQYVAQRARGAYVASVCQPEAAYDLSRAAQAIDVAEKDVNDLNKRLQWQIDNAARGIRFTKLQGDLQLLVFTDASFANNKDLSSQIGYVLVLADTTGNGNIIHWSSTKCKRVTRSVLASELYAMVHGFDMGASIKATIEKALSIDLPLVVCTDSKSLYDCLVKLGTTSEKRLMIDVMCLRQAYERREIAEVKWINGNNNPADSMTKEKSSGALKRLLDTNKVKVEALGWVEREDNRKGSGDGDIDGDDA